MIRLNEKVRLISGSARGIGAAEARLFKSQGATVWIADVFDAEGVRVNSIPPGLIETPMAGQLGPGLDRVVKRTPIGRVAHADEVASDESSYSTGSEFVIDGGLSSL